MTAVIDTARIVRWSATSAFADLRATYTWKTWVFAWLVRILCQVVFYALIGRLLGSQSQVNFLLVGNAVFVGVTTALFVVPSTMWERATGTLPLQIASPSHPFVGFAGRSLQWLADGIGVSTASLVLVSLLFGVRHTWWGILAAIPMSLVTFFSAYWLGLTIAGFILGRPVLRNVAGNLAGLVLMILCGVQVPTSFWPAPLQRIAQFLPLTHGLQAIRDALAGSGPVWMPLLLEACVGLGWFLVAALTFRRFADHGRKTGTIEFDE
jgi:ABC-2 type transport system permease protein